MEKYWTGFTRFTIINYAEEINFEVAERGRKANKQVGREGNA